MWVNFFFIPSLKIFFIFKRNNIFKVHGLDEEGLYKAIPAWCRMDREINFWKSEREEREEYYYLVCVLYDNEWRKDVVLDD